MEVLRSVAAALLQDVRGTGGQSEVIAEKAATIHYLFYTLTLMRCVMTEKERCLHQARVLDHLLAAIWNKGVPSQIVQEARDSQEPMVRRALQRLSGTRVSGPSTEPSGYYYHMVKSCSGQ